METKKFAHFYMFFFIYFRLINFLENFLKQERNRKAAVVQSLVCARLLQGVLTLCLNFQKCSTFNGVSNEWILICNNFNKSNVQLWRNWVKNCQFQIERSAENVLNKMEHDDLLQILPVGYILDKMI